MLKYIAGRLKIGSVFVINRNVNYTVSSKKDLEKNI